jgi:hypothetical protein
MVKLVTPDKVDAALTAAVNAGDDTSVPDTPNNAFKAAMQAKGFFEDAGAVSNIPTPLVTGNFLKVRSDLELEWATIDTLPTTGGEKDKVLVIREGKLVWEYPLPKPYIANRVLSNDGTSLMWKELPDTKLPPVSECTSDTGCILTVVNNEVVWEPYTPGGDSLLPETDGKGGKVLITDGTALESGGGLSWEWPAGAPGSGTPGSIIGYAHAYSITDGDRADVFTFESEVYPDIETLADDTQDPGVAPYRTLAWGSTLATTVDKEGGELGHWTADGEFVFERDAYVMVNAGQQVVANFNSATGKTISADIYIVHSRYAGELDGKPVYDSDILDGQAGRDFVWPYHSTPIISGTMSCATTVSAGDKILVTALVTMFDGSPGTLSYGSLHHSLRANFGILATVGFPMPDTRCPILAEAMWLSEAISAVEFETDELAIEALADYDSDAYRTFGAVLVDKVQDFDYTFVNSDDISEMDLVVNMYVYMELQLSASVEMEFYEGEGTVPPEALLLYYEYDTDEEAYKAPVVLSRITTESGLLKGTLEYAGGFGNNDRIRVAYSYVSSRYAGTMGTLHCKLTLRSCTGAPS